MNNLKGVFKLEKEINLQELINLMLKRWWIIAISVVFFGVSFFIYNSYYVSKLYTSFGSVYVNNKAQRVISKEDINNTANLVDLTTSEKLVDTYIAILKTNNFFNTVKKNTNFDYSIEQLKGMVSYSSVEESAIIEVRATAASPKEAQKVCEAILTYANYAIMDIVEVGSVKTIDDATLPVGHSYPNITRSTLLGMFLGLVLSCGFIFLINFFDVKIKTSEDIEKKYDVVVIGIIPSIA
ncbi:MAG: hypothetical protein IJQ50_03840, partial [Clostridia bacterium]|nr:hypothetical protein [Clostridia bacterium]